jgi:hypothetical protein
MYIYWNIWKDMNLCIWNKWTWKPLRNEKFQRAHRKIDAFQIGVSLHLSILILFKCGSLPNFPHRYYWIRKFTLTFTRMSKRHRRQAKSTPCRQKRRQRKVCLSSLQERLFKIMKMNAYLNCGLLGCCAWSLTLKMGAASSSETLVCIRNTAQHSDP